MPFPFLHVDTGFKFQEMYAFRDQRARDTGIDLRVWRNESAIAGAANPFALGTERCCGLLKTEALLTGLASLRADAAIGGARREEERSRAKERVFSVRSASGQWDPRRQRPELWQLYNGRLAPGESMRVFPLSNWTELDVWRYIEREGIPVNPLYFAQEREIDRAWRPAADARRAVHRGWRVSAAGRRRGAARALPLPQPRLRAVQRRRAVVGDDGGGHHRGTAGVADLGAQHPRHRPRPRRVDGTQEARGLLLMTRDLVRVCTMGSVDDGKSTLIGRLLHDTHSLPDDQIEAVRLASAKNGSGLAFDYSLVTDGLKAEREQGITIDVAYRYFSTPKRAFIVADVPGHEQYTRNMATGASTAHLALLLVDATRGVLPQTRRHAFIASLLGIPRLVVAVNKMDLVDYAESAFEAIGADFREFAARLGPLDLRLVPVASRDGVNLVTRDTRRRCPGTPVSRCSRSSSRSTSAATATSSTCGCRCSSSCAGADGSRSLAGPVVSGVVREGDELLVLPSRATARVRTLMASAGGNTAFPPLAATLTLDRDIDVGRGDLLVHPGNVPTGRTSLDAMVVWLDETPLEVGRRYLLKHTTRTVLGARREAGLCRRREHAQPQRRAHAGPARHRPAHAHRLAAAVRRCVCAQQGHRQLHPDRSGYPGHGRRRHGRGPRHAGPSGAGRRRAARSSARPRPSLRPTDRGGWASAPSRYG